MYVYIYNIEYVTHFWVVPFLLLILSQFWSPLYLHVNIFEPLDNLQWRKLGYFTLDPAPSQPKKRGTKDWPPQKMGWTKHTIPGLQPSLITYTSLIKASAQTGDLFSAEAWLRAAESSGLRLDIQIFTAVIDAAARADPNGRIDGELVIQTG